MATYTTGAENDAPARVQGGECPEESAYQLAIVHDAEALPEVLDVTWRIGEDKEARATEHHQALTKITPTLASDSTRLLAQLIDTIEFLQLRSTWLPLLPSCIGRNQTLDAAAAAIVYAARYNVHLLRGTDDGQLRRRALVSNAIAVQHLRRAMGSSQRLSDEVLATIFLLGWFQVLVPDRAEHTGSLFQHHKALSAMLLARPRSWPTTPLARAIVHTSVPIQFNYSTQDPNAAMHPIFEDERWLEAVPAVCDTLPENLVKLRHNALALFMRLPRLMNHVKLLRDGSQGLLESCQSLASAVLEIEERDAENALLHQVSVTPTSNQEDANVTAYSYSFPSEVFLIGAINYWQTRMMVLQLCLSVDHSAIMLTGKNWLTTETSINYFAEQDRMAKNVIMSWQYIKEDYLPGRLQIIPALKVVWASTEGRQTTTQGQETSVIRSWILSKRQHMRSSPSPSPSQDCS